MLLLYMPCLYTSLPPADTCVSPPGSKPSTRPMKGRENARQAPPKRDGPKPQLHTQFWFWPSPRGPDRHRDPLADSGAPRPGSDLETGHTTWHANGANAFLQRGGLSFNPWPASSDIQAARDCALGHCPVAPELCGVRGFSKIVGC